MNVAPTGGHREMFGRCNQSGTSLSDEIHAAEIGHPIIDDQEFPMIAPVEHAQDGKTVKGFPDGMEAMNLDSRLLHLAEECRRGGLTADGIVQNADVEAPAGALLKCLRHGTAGNVI